MRSKQTTATPAAANRQQLTHPTPGGGGLNQASKPRRADERGSGERKDIQYLYRIRLTLRTISFNRNRSSQASKQPPVCIERMMMREVKNRPRRSTKKGKNTGADEGETPTGLIGGGNKQLIAKNHSKKTINEPLIRHDLKYTQSHGRNQPMKGNSHNQHIHPPLRSKQRPPPGTRQTTAGNNEPGRPSSPLPDTIKRGGQSRQAWQ